MIPLSPLRCRNYISFIVLAVTFARSGLLFANDGVASSEVKFSSFAPLPDLESQFLSFLEGIGKELENQEEYDKSVQDRIALDSATVAVLAQTLGLHDEDNPYKARAGKLVELAANLSGATSDHAQASKSWQKLKAASSDTAINQAATSDPAADLVLLMKQVPIVNNALRRGVESKRFDRSIEKTAGYAVTIAAIAQASQADTNYCNGEEDERQWRQICADLRNASMEVYQAVRAKDQEKAKAGAARMVTTCDACHEKFR